MTDSYYYSPLLADPIGHIAGGDLDWTHSPQGDRIAKLEQQVADLQAEVAFLKDLADGIAEDYEREIEKMYRHSGDRSIAVVVEPVAGDVAEVVATILRKNAILAHVAPSRSEHDCG